MACLMLAALESSWAKAALPWGVYLRMAFPKKAQKPWAAHRLLPF